MWGRRTLTVFQHLEGLGIQSIVNINELTHAAQGRLEWPWFVRQQRQDYGLHARVWEKLYGRLADDESQQTLLDVLRYRLTGNIRYLWNYSIRLKDQYFEDFMTLTAETFVDAGGFDGDTTEEFCRRYPDYRKVYVFEPSETNLRAARRRLQGLRDIEFLALGLSDKPGELYFNAEAGSASSVSTSGSHVIKVTSLDGAVSDPVTFIKMDLEGWEMKALAGCRSHITVSKPKLAVSVYHSACDFRDVPDYLLALNPDYKVYLRHYTQGWSESVMFFR